MGHMHTDTHTYYMALALQLAEQGRATVSPNPMVGCVIVKNSHIVGQGFHQCAGEPHAEVIALCAAGAESAGATVYVTLEPCCHYGRTPPCIQALITARVDKVYVACLDPNPLVAGKGVAALQAAGIAVEVGMGEQAAQRLNEVFFHYITYKRPFVIAKWAMSFDGKTVTNQQDSRYISHKDSLRHIHHLRQHVDAILIGAHTARQDNPQLTARFTADAKQPLRIILSSHDDLPVDLKIFDAHLPGKTVIATTASKQESMQHHEVIILPADNTGRVSLMHLLEELGKREITSLLVEGGMTVHASFFNANLVNKIHVYLAPVIIGALPVKQPVKNVHCEQVGRDFC